MNPLHIFAICILSVLYAWIVYNIPVFAVGLRFLKSARETGRPSRKQSRKLPKVSIIVPVKDEEKVVGRLLNSLLSLDYPLDMKEILVVEDGSIDKTLEICEDYARQHPCQLKVVHRSTSEGKPSALNSGLKYASGDIVAVFDADSVPERDILLKAVKYFEDSSIAAVQGRTLSINADENMLTKIASFEEIVRFEVYYSGKDQLRLYLPLSGSCQFVKRKILEDVGGWNENSLCEDVDFSANLTEKGYCIKYASDVRAWQENPQSLSQMVRQRLRWYRGWIEVTAKYGRLLLKPSRKTFDAEVTFMLPFLLPLTLLLYPLALLTFATPFPPVFAFLIQATVALNAVLPFFLALGFFLVDRSRRRNLSSWLLWTYVYWVLHIFTACYALLEFVVRRRKPWIKTTKSGKVTDQRAFTRMQSETEA